MQKIFSFPQQVSFALVLYPLLSTGLQAADDHGVLGNYGTNVNRPPATNTWKSGNVVGLEVIEEKSAGTEFWTPERMRNAKPLDIIRKDEPVLQDKAQGMPAGGASGPAVLVPGEEGDEPEGAPIELYTVPKTAADMLPNSAEDQSKPTSYPYYGTEVFDDYTGFPYRTIGKLFWIRKDKTDNKDKAYVCSAAAVVSEHRRLVITAGHCVAEGDGDTWSREVIFVPAYKDGETPYGKWNACGLYTSGAWFNKQNPDYDIGAIKICDVDGGKPIHKAIGALGFAANADRYQNWDAFGYPAGEPFTGERLFTCQAPFGLDDPNGLNTIGIGCNMTGGSSGGPWILKFSLTDRKANYINGLNSYGYPSIPEVMFSPYFGDNAIEVRKFAMDNGA